MNTVRLRPSRLLRTHGLWSAQISIAGWGRSMGLHGPKAGKGAGVGSVGEKQNPATEGGEGGRAVMARADMRAGLWCFRASGSMNPMGAEINPASLEEPCKSSLRYK